MLRNIVTITGKRVPFSNYIFLPAVIKTKVAEYRISALVHLCLHFPVPMDESKKVSTTQVQ